LADIFSKVSQVSLPIYKELRAFTTIDKTGVKELYFLENWYLPL
jgi:hypothetical protein